MKKDVVKQKSFAFALRVVKLAKYPQSEQKEFVLSTQTLGAYGVEERKQGHQNHARRTTA